MTFNPCLVIPLFNHEGPLPAILAELRGYGLPCIIVDDGSSAACAAVAQGLAEQYPWVRYVRQDPNMGKGSAVKRGLREAFALGYSHAIQIDADGQHRIADLPRFLDAARAHPGAVIAGKPIFDASVPRLRFFSRYLTHILVWINTLSLTIRDSMCGFRVYPIAICLDLIDRHHLGNRMDFDTEILVRLYWDEVAIRSLPTPVRYPADGLSHFLMVYDNILMALMHARMFLGMLPRSPRLIARHFR